MKKLYIALFLGTLSLSAQQDKDSISTEVINVITSYKPSISDAFKANESPKISIQSSDKNNIKYGIKSTPIQSIFKPYSGSYKSAITNYSKSGYTNYVKVGYGNYGTPLLEGFLYKKKKKHEAEFILYNKSSSGGIKDVVLDDKYLMTKLALNYKNTQKKQIWEAGISYQRDIYNWYGIPFLYEDSVIDAINEKQTYNYFTLKGNIQLKEGVLKKAEGSLDIFSDKHKSKESRFYFSSSFELPINDHKILAKANINILDGEFAQDYTNTGAIEYGYLNFVAEINYPIERENLYISLGAKINYNSDIENNTSKLYIYPNININFVMIDELLNLYGGFTGGIIQNSYRSITLENPYVSPTLNIKPTSNTFRLFAGFKGKLTSRISYDVNASYSQDEDKLLFRSNKNLTDGTTTVSNGYQAGNSFYALYDNTTTLGLYGELSASLLKNIETGISLSINSYSMNNEDEPWNLPSYIATAFGTYTFGKWKTKAELFAKGKRNDLIIDSNDAETLVELDGYLDLNISADYIFNRKWSAFIQLNNILNTNYQVYSNFQVQGFQVLAGGVYHFDF
ncbi:hypothetical protein [Flavicella sp.]|uniref:hypothetical protein n=1 Tax=Flavicella sp. TaxID=2957742 RepID=UPI0030189753